MEIVPIKSKHEDTQGAKNLEVVLGQIMEPGLNKEENKYRLAMCERKSSRN